MPSVHYMKDIDDVNNSAAGVKTNMFGELNNTINEPELLVSGIEPKPIEWTINTSM